jgi:predicted outer membrane lipoprotein
MKWNRAWFVGLLLAFAFTFAAALVFQSKAAGLRDLPVPEHRSVDWSHRHLIYSGQPTGPNAWAAMRDPRYLRHFSMYGGHESRAGDRRAPGGWRDALEGFLARHHEQAPFERDWQFNLGTNAVVGPFNNNGNGYSFPAKFSFDINATPSCTNDFVVFTTGSQGATGGQASIVAINRLYSGSGAGGTGICGTGQPSVMWAYNTNLSGDVNGEIFSSPVLSLDGKRVAFVETNNGAAILKILKWVSGQGTASAAAAPTPITTGNAWSTCPASGTSCLFSLSFSGGAADSYSSPFYNYDTDALYVGDDVGKLHKFTGVFAGTPAEVTAGGWPITVSSGNTLTGPVFDSVSGNIFVADISTSLHYVRETGSIVGACASGSPPCNGTPSLPVSAGGGVGAFDPPTVDVTSQRVFVFSAVDPNAAQVNAVYQATTALGSSVEVPLGSTAENYIYSGAFDKNYNSGSYASGFLYVCGTSPQTTLYRIGFNSTGVMNSTAAAGTVSLSSSVPSCSPMTEILNGTNDYLFFGLDALGGTATGCTSGCLMGLNLTGMTWPPALSRFSVLPVPNGPSGIVVDNVGTGGQESSVYFGPSEGANCTTPSGSGCAVKATQSGLN